ncbi:hypothetical protein D9M73_230950 [compost metagenome]
MLDVQLLRLQGQRHLLVDRRGGQAEGFSHGVGGGEHHPAHAAQVHGRQAHGARLAAGVDHAAIQARAQLPAGGADGLEFGVAGGVLGQVDFIHRAGQHLAVAHQHRAEWADTDLDIGASQIDRLAHEVFVMHGKSSSEERKYEVGAFHAEIK